MWPKPKADTEMARSPFVKIKLAETLTSWGYGTMLLHKITVGQTLNG